ncbi:hypothetical protein CL657_02880 [bacterium]|nr:hypothetical protein [bacterium]|tara:strand:- start:254 stop:1501 length:1248 start_codon:yes stop_codon:yes gene_type:complete
MINCCIFEDDTVSNLFPITETRPIYTCHVGISSLFEKFYQAFKYSNITLHCRDYLKPTLQDTYKQFPINNINTGSPCLLYNGRSIITEKLVNKIKKIDPNQNTLFTFKGTVIVAYLKGNLLEVAIHLLKDLPNNTTLIKELRSKCVVVELDECNLITTPWDIIDYNQEYLLLDCKHSKNLGIIKGHISPFTSINEESNVFIDKNSYIEDFVVIDAKKGPVYIEQHVTIHAHTRIEGPAFIGNHSTIFGGRVSNSTINSFCKICGEITTSIIESYSNKAHAGFLGNSYVGQWVNLGADTTTSNLKNDYNNIKIIFEKTKITTNKQFLGTIFGDHVKTSIGTKLNCGTIIRVGSVIFNHNFSKKYYPPFSWGNAEKQEFFKLEKFFQALERIMKRRKIELSDNYKNLITLLHKSYTK